MEHAKEVGLVKLLASDEVAEIMQPGEPPFDGLFDEFRFMRRSAGNATGDRKTMAVRDRHDFTAFSSASQADSSTPFFAELLGTGIHFRPGGEDKMALYMYNFPCRLA